MSAITKVFIVIFLFLITFIGGFGAGYFIRKTDNISSTEYRNRIAELEGQLRVQVARNSEITSINKSITEQLNFNIQRAGKAEKALGDIANGISSDVGSIDKIISIIRKIRDSLEKYYFTKEHNSNSSWSSNNN